MKKITEELIKKDTTVHKVQFDREWFFVVEDLEDYLNEDLAGIESVTLSVDYDGEMLSVKCATWQDVERFLQKDPVEGFRGSVLKSRKK